MQKREQFSHFLCRCVKIPIFEAQTDIIYEENNHCHRRLFIVRKSTMAKDLAREIGYIYIDSGAMYRAVTLYCMEHGLFNADGSIREKDLQDQMDDIHISFRLDADSQRPQTYLNDVCVEDRIRSLEVSSHVSPVAALGFVRQALVRQQQAMGKEKGIVMDGRDIGTAVFPDAELKIFVTASAEIRARRRYDELKAKDRKLPSKTFCTM